MNRGSTAKRSKPEKRKSRFNEAPIHESGKCRAIRLGHARRRRFNEAPIHESGKSRKALPEATSDALLQ